MKSSVVASLANNISAKPSRNIFHILAFGCWLLVTAGLFTNVSQTQCNRQSSLVQEENPKQSALNLYPLKKRIRLSTGLSANTQQRGGRIRADKPPLIIIHVTCVHCDPLCNVLYRHNTIAVWFDCMSHGRKRRQHSVCGSVLRQLDLCYMSLACPRSPYFLSLLIITV